MGSKTVEGNIVSINIFGEVNDVLADKFLQELAAAEALPDTLYVNVILSTMGGDIFPAMAMHDAIKTSTLLVNVCATGQCMSAGVLILQAGDVRTATPNTRFMVHNPISAMEGNSVELHNSVKEIHHINNRYKQIVGKKTTLKRKELSDLMNKESYFWTPSAVKYGLIDAVLKPLKKGTKC